MTSGPYQPKYAKAFAVLDLLNVLAPSIVLAVVAFWFVAPIAKAEHYRADIVLAGFILALTVTQLVYGMIPTRRRPTEYIFIPIAFGTMSEFFRDGDPNRMLSDGWEIVGVTTEGVLFKR